MTGTETPKHVEGALDTILDQGILGAFCVLLLFALSYSIRGWLREKDQRLSDQKETAKALADLNLALRDLVIESNKIASNLVIDTTRSSDAVKNTLHTQEKALDDLRDGIVALQHEQARLVLTIQAMPQGRK